MYWSFLQAIILKNISKVRSHKLQHRSILQLSIFCMLFEAAFVNNACILSILLIVWTPTRQVYLSVETNPSTEITSETEILEALMLTITISF